MFKKKTLPIILTTVTCIMLGCATETHKDPTKNQAGFLPNYQMLKPLPNNTESVQNYAYKKPNVKKSRYYAVILNPVVLYQPQNESSGPKISSEVVQTAREEIRNKIREELFLYLSLPR